MFKAKFIFPAVIAVAGFLISTTNSSAKPAYVAKTKQKCAYCHVDAQKTPKELTNAGKYYGEKKTLDGYKEAK